MLTIDKKTIYYIIIYLFIVFMMIERIHKITLGDYYNEI